MGISGQRERKSWMFFTLPEAAIELQSLKKENGCQSTISAFGRFGVNEEIFADFLSSWWLGDLADQTVIGMVL